MPVYEYVCRDCGRAFERYVQRWSEAVTCPGCAGGEVEKQLSTFAMAGRASGSAGGAMAGGGPMTGGGCCGGGGCGCH